MYAYNRVRKDDAKTGGTIAIILGVVMLVVQIRAPAPSYRGYNIRLCFWWPRGLGFGDVEVHV